MNRRESLRMGRLEISRVKLEKQIAQLQENPKVLGLFTASATAERLAAKRNKLAEVETAQRNLRTFGHESPPSGNPVGAGIGVPHAGGSN